MKLLGSRGTLNLPGGGLQLTSYTVFAPPPTPLPMQGDGGRAAFIGRRPLQERQLRAELN